MQKGGTQQNQHFRSQKAKKKKKKGGKRKKKLLELEEEINEKDSLIDEIHQEYKKIQNELTSYKTEINSLQNYITKLEAGLDINTQINNLKNIIYEKEQLLLTLSDQIAEYQSQCDDIIAGKSLKEKEEQIKLLISEVKAIRGKILNIITFNKRISNFDEFINCVDLIQQIKNDNSSDNNNKIKIAFEKINYLIDIYKQNNEDYYNKLIREIFKIYEKDNNVNEDNNNKEENREEK
jgi:chromosome segregation ATPase